LAVSLAPPAHPALLWRGAGGRCGGFACKSFTESGAKFLSRIHVGYFFAV